MSEPPFAPASLDPDLSRLSPADHHARRVAIVRHLAQHLTSGTANQLAARGRQPFVEIRHAYATEPQLEGTLLEAEIITINADVIEVTVPGEATPRHHTPGERFYFHARHDGCVEVVARNVLNPTPTRASSMPIFVIELDRFRPQPFRELTINGLTGDQVAELSTAMLAARAEGLELDPWAASRTALNLPEDLQEAARADLASLDDLTRTVNDHVREVGEILTGRDDSARRAQSISDDVTPPPHPIELRAPISERVLREARAAADLILRTDHQPTLDDLRAAIEERLDAD